MLHYLMQSLFFVMDEIGVFKSWGSTSEGNMPADDGFFKKKDKFFQ